MLSHPLLVAQRAALASQAPRGAAAGIQLELLSRWAEVSDPPSVPDSETGYSLGYTQSSLRLYFSYEE